MKYIIPLFLELHIMLYFCI